MVKNTRSGAKGAKAKKETKKESIFNKETTRFIVGLFTLVMALLMLFSITSYFFTGAADQSYIEDPRGGAIVQNHIGRLGALVADFWVNRCFGISSYFISFFLVFMSMKLLRAYKIRLWKWFIHCAFLTIWLSIALAYFANDWFSDSFINPGGQHGIFVSQFIHGEIGGVGLVLILLAALLLYLTYVTDETINVVRKMLNPTSYIKRKEKTEEPTQPLAPVEYETEAPVAKRPNFWRRLFSKKKKNQPQATQGAPIDTEEATLVATQVPTQSVNPYAEMPQTLEFAVDGDDAVVVLEEEKKSAQFEVTEPVAPPVAITAPAAPLTDEMEVVMGQEEEHASGVSLEPYDPKLDLELYKYPTLDLLKKYENDVPAINMVEQTANKDRIVTVLRNFGVEISTIKATVGPTITLYEITPAQGVRISKIRNLEDDIALSLSALGIRIIAPIPGKGTIGIEVPNEKANMVSMESVLNSKKFQDTDYDLPIVLGKTITNEVFMVDLAKMPHLLVAGATGQGKSVGLNAIITSLLYKKHPSELKLVMVDPKKVEFSIYSPIENHFLAKIPDENSESIITDVTKVVQTLKSICQEMDTRYDLLKKAHVRTIKEYNEKFKNRMLNPENGHKFMPYIVVIIDEFGDLIMTAGKEVELPIARIAQLARAVGIHAIIATQRPTTNIITGTIKANFPARMAFKVSAMIDSRTILDRPGSERLIGRGDMLFLTGSDPVRVQCAFVDTPEVERITSYVARQQGYGTPYELPEVLSESMDDMGGAAAVDMNNLDPLFAEAARLIVIHQQGSTSLIQRKFSIGYNRAGRLMDQLERAGVVGPTQGSKPRDVLCTDEADLELRINSLG